MKKQFKGIRHGEIALIPVRSIPREGNIIPRGDYIVGHSETGHFHILEGTAFEVTEQDDGNIFVNVLKDTKLVHKKTHDKHRALVIPPSVLERYHMVDHDPRSEAIRVVKD